MESYEIVYSAALERQGLGMTLSAARGNSTLRDFDGVDTLAYGDTEPIYRKLGIVPPTKRRWHVNRSKRLT